MSSWWRAGRQFVAGTVREWRMMRRYPASMISLALWALFLPVVQLAQAKGFAGGDPAAQAAFAQRAGTTHVAGYLYLGWAVYLWVSTVLWGPGLSLRQEQLRGTLEAVYTTPASRFALLFGPAPAHLVSAGAVFATVLAALRYVFGLPIGAAAVLRTLLVLLVGAPALLALGGLFATVVLYFRDADGLVQAVRGALTLLCGVTFPLAVLPGWARDLGSVLPPTQVITALRQAVLGGGPVRLHAGQLLLAAGLIGALAQVFLVLTMRAAGRTGRLGQF